MGDDIVVTSRGASAAAKGKHSREGFRVDGVMHGETATEVTYGTSWNKRAFINFADKALSYSSLQLQLDAPRASSSSPNSFPDPEKLASFRSSERVVESEMCASQLYDSFALLYRAYRRRLFRRQMSSAELTLASWTGSDGNLEQCGIYRTTWNPSLLPHAPQVKDRPAKAIAVALPPTATSFPSRLSLQQPEHQGGMVDSTASISHTSPTLSPLRAALQACIATLHLSLPPLNDSETWRTHTSYKGAAHDAFERPPGLPVWDYERREVSGAERRARRRGLC